MRSGASPVVIDASVAVKWVLREPGRAESLRWLDAYEAAQLTRIAPTLLVAEVASALTKRRRRKEITAAQAREGLRFFQQRLPVLVDFRPHMGSAFELSLLHGVSFCDGVYLALAIERGCDLVTADTKFHRAVGQAYPFVQPL